MIDSKLQEELRKEYNPENSDLRKAQLRMLEMLKFIDKICKENNLTYWLDSGTLLGAARHKGFIPWDDDTDICMPIDDMKKLKHIMISHNTSNEFVIQCKETDPGYWGQWIVLRDLKSEYLQNSKLHAARKFRGLQVDIFPVEKNVSPFSFKLCSLLTENLLNRFLFRFKTNILLKLWLNISYFIIYNILIPILRFFDNIFHKSDYCLLTYGCPFYYKIYNKDVYPLSEIEFEGLKFKCPQNYDSYLRNLYGNWEIVPTKCEIKTHEVKIIFKE